MRLSLFILCAAVLSASGLDVVVKPETPTIYDVVEIEIHGCTQPGTLHWGVNADGGRWGEALPAFRPPGSTMDGVATRTRMDGPDGEGICRVKLGPFQDTNQLVRSISFALQWDDGTWSNKDEKNFNIRVSRGRISWSPEKPTVNDRITVRVRDSRHGGQLRWGVNAEADLWKTPITNYWLRGTSIADDKIGVDTPLGRPDAKGVSTVVIGPFNTAKQIVRTLHLAAHWGDEWETDASRNYNLAIRRNAGDGEPFVEFESPRDGEIIVDAPDVVLNAENADEVDMWLNGRNVATLREAPFQLRIPFRPLGYGMHKLTARAERAGRVGLEEIDFWKIPPHAVIPLPEGTPWGATVNGDGTVTFALHAPEKKFVSLVGDFNDWNSYSNMMQYSPDGTWWITRPVSNGVWTYQYMIEGRQLIADPYARDVTWVDARGREGHRPEDAKAVLAVGQPAYTWQATNFVRPSLNNLSIYELHIDDVSPGGGFNGLIARLDYIKRLGFTAIQPMPFQEFTIGKSWGYNPAFHFAPETAYGTPDDLKRLVDETHKRGMAFIVDIVFNHMDRNSPLYQLYGSDYDASPYFRDFRGDNWGFPDLDQTTRAMKRYTADVIRHWIQEYRVDGYRYDATRWVEWQGYNDWGASWFAYAAREADPASVQIAEHLPADPALINNTEMDTGWGDHFHWRIKEMVQQAFLDQDAFRTAMDPRREGFTNMLSRIAYTESHDEERMMRELLAKGYSRDEAVRRAGLALALTLTAPGPAMVYAGQEFGEDTKKVVGPNPMNWSKLGKVGRKSLAYQTGALLKLREANPALAAENVWISYDHLPTNVAVFHRWNGDDTVVVAANFGKSKQAVSIPLPFAGTWADVLDDGRVHKTESAFLESEMAGGEVRVLARVLEQRTLANP